MAYDEGTAQRAHDIRIVPWRHGGHEESAVVSCPRLKCTLRLGPRPGENGEGLNPSSLYGLCICIGYVILCTFSTLRSHDRFSHFLGHAVYIRSPLVCELVRTALVFITHTSSLHPKLLLSSWLRYVYNAFQRRATADYRRDDVIGSCYSLQWRPGCEGGTPSPGHDRESGQYTDDQWLLNSVDASCL